MAYLEEVMFCCDEVVLNYNLSGGSAMLCPDIPGGNKKELYYDLPVGGSIMLRPTWRRGATRRRVC